MLEYTMVGECVESYMRKDVDNVSGALGYMGVNVVNNII